MKRSLLSLPASEMVLFAMNEKKPSSSRTVIITIIPIRSVIVLKSMAFMASSSVKTPKTIIATAPKNDAEGLSIFMPGRPVKIIPM